MGTTEVLSSTSAELPTSYMTQLRSIAVYLIAFPSQSVHPDYGTAAKTP